MVRAGLVLGRTGAAMLDVSFASALPCTDVSREQVLPLYPGTPGDGRIEACYVLLSYNVCTAN